MVDYNSNTKNSGKMQEFTASQIAKESATKCGTSLSMPLPVCNDNTSTFSSHVDPRSPEIPRSWMSHAPVVIMMREEELPFSHSE